MNQDSGFWHASSVKQGRLQACFRNVIYRFLEVTDELQRRYTWMRVMGRQPCRLKVSNPIYVEHTGNLYEIRDSHSTDGHFVKSVRGRIEIAAKASLVGLGSEIRDLRGGKSAPHLILNRRENLK